MFPLYIVHCTRLRERHTYLAPILQRFGWPAHWIEQCDPGEIPAGLWVAPRRPALTQGEISVYLKHLEVFRDVLRRHYDVAFVLEDDPVFPDGFLEMFADYQRALPSQFDLVCFGASGGQEVAADAETPRFGREHRTRSMSGYLITASCCRVLLDALEQTPIADPVDLSTNRVIRTHGLRVYWSVPALIANGTETGRFEHSLGVRWRQRTLVARLSRVYGRMRHRLHGRSR